MGTVKICAYDPEWPHAFDAVARGLRSLIGDAATRIDHIGSTSVPGLDAKDVIDVQVSVADAENLERVSRELARGGWIAPAEVFRDHPVPGVSAEPSDWQKRFFSQPDGMRRVNVHVRIEGRHNQRYALLFRDYLRVSPSSASAYAMLKRHLALLLPDESERYADVKDPACDLIYFAAEQWATQTGWYVGLSDG